MNVLVVLALIGFGRWGEQWFLQFLALDQSGRHLNPMNRSALLVLCPSGSYLSSAMTPYMRRW